MHIRPPDHLVRPPLSASRRSRRRRTVLGWMLAGSVLLHLAVLALFWLLRAHGEPAETAEANSDVAVVFQSAGAKQAATASPAPAAQPSQAVGNPEGVTHPPTPTTATEAPSAPPAPPQPETPAPPQPQPPGPQAPQQEASLETPPQPETPPTPPAPVQPPAPTPPTPAPPTPTPPPTPETPPTVSLNPSDEGETTVVPQFVMPQPPLPLPSLPPARARPPARPHAYTQATPRSRSGFPMPQNWSLATGPESLLSQRGTDVSTRPRGSQSNAEYKHLAGTDPGEDWAAELHRWASDHAYYPREAADNGEEGVATIQAVIDRYGKVVSVELVEGSGSAFLDMSWLGEWRNATVPRFPPGTPGDTTTILYTIHYILVHR